LFPSFFTIILADGLFLCNRLFMLSRCFSAAIYGLDASVVEVEVSTGRGLPQVVIVGLPDKAVTGLACIFHKF